MSELCYPLCARNRERLQRLCAGNGRKARCGLCLAPRDARQSALPFSPLAWLNLAELTCGRFGPDRSYNYQPGTSSPSSGAYCCPP
jgi:hypothetical protein